MDSNEINETEAPEMIEIGGVQAMMLEQAMPRIVRDMARQAIAHGADGKDSNGFIKHMVRGMDLDVFAWFAICREVEAISRNNRRIGFIQ